MAPAWGTTQGPSLWHNAGLRVDNDPQSPKGDMSLEWQLQQHGMAVCWRRLPQASAVLGSRQNEAVKSMAVGEEGSVAWVTRWLTWPEEAPGSPGQQHRQRLGQEHPPPCSGILPQHCASPTCLLPASRCLQHHLPTVKHERDASLYCLLSTAVELCQTTLIVWHQPQQCMRT